MDKEKEINSPKMTLNFLIWVGGVFMLLPVRISRAFRLEDFLGIRKCCPRNMMEIARSCDGFTHALSSQMQSGPASLGPHFKIGQILEGDVRKGDASSAKRGGTSGIVDER